MNLKEHVMTTKMYIYSHDKKFIYKILKHDFKAIVLFYRTYYNFN